MGQQAIYDLDQQEYTIYDTAEVIHTKWDNFRFIDLFAGIGGIRLGFEAAGGRCVFSSEFDEDACKTYNLGNNYVAGANIAAFTKLANAMIAQGII